jgi:hypothetical protein
MQAEARRRTLEGMAKARVARALTSSDFVVDTSTKISRSEAFALYAAGVTVVIRYVFFGISRPGDLDAAELQDLLDAKLTVVVVCHVPEGPNGGPWHATGDLGRQHSLAAVANAIKVGYVTPDDGPRLSFASDHENVHNFDADSVDYVRQSCRVRAASNYGPVPYIGFAAGVTVSDLDAVAGDPSCGNPHFWCDFAPIRDRPTPTRGFALHQRAESRLAGIEVDRDDVLQDGVIFGLAQIDTDPVVVVNDPVAGGAPDPAA